MTGIIHSVAASAPPYCTSGHGVLTPSQWTTCAKLGWSQSTTGAATAGTFTGHNFAPILIGVIIGVIILALTRGRSRAPATSK